MILVSPLMCLPHQKHVQNRRLHFFHCYCRSSSFSLMCFFWSWQNNGNYITYKSLSRKIQRTTLRSCLVSQCTSCDYGVITERVRITFWGTSTRHISFIVQVCTFLLFQYKLGMYCTYLSCRISILGYDALQVLYKQETIFTSSGCTYGT